MQFEKIDLKKDLTNREPGEVGLFEHLEVEPASETMLYLKLNAKQLDGESFQNFNAIKTNVHSLIKKQGGEERFNCRELKNLKSVMEKLKEEDGTIYLKNQSRILNFEIDNISKNIFMVLENGKIGVSHINARKISVIENGALEARCRIYDLKIDEEISQIIWLKKNHLALVMENSIMVLSLRNPRSLKSFYIFNNEQNADTDSPITEAKFSSKHHCFYVRLQEKENENLFFRFETDFFKMTDSSIQTVPLEITAFGVSGMHPAVLYAVSGERLVRFRLNEGREPVGMGRKSSLQSKLSRVDTFRKMESYSRDSEISGMLRNNTESFGGRTDFGGEYHFREVEVYKGNDEISALYLDWESKLAYLRVDNEIRKICLVRGIMVGAFQGHEFNIISVVFSKDFKMMFTQDENGIVRIWKTETNKLHATLGYILPSDHSKLGLSEKFHLVVNHPEGLKIWKLQDALFVVDANDLSDRPREIVLAEGGTMWVRSDKSISQVKTRNNRKMKKSQIFEGFDNENENIKMLPSGDLILKDTMVLGEKGAWGSKFKTRLILQANVPSVVKRKEKLKSEGDLYELKEFGRESSVELGIERELKVVLAEVNGKVTCMSVITNSGLKWPKVYENGHILSKPNFVEAHCNDIRIEMTLGTASGDCLKVGVLFDMNKRLKTQEVEKEVTQWEPSKSYISPKEENERELLSVSTDTEGPRGLPGQLHSGINAYQRFSSHETEVFLFCSKPRVAKKNESQTRQQLVIFARSKFESWSRLNISLDSIIEVREDQFFRLLQVDRKSSKESIRFCVYNQFALVLLEYETTSGLLTLLKMLPMSMSEDQDLMFSPKLNQFYIPTKQSIQIWDGLLQILQTTVEFESEILQTQLISQPRHLIFVYDRTNYYELDLSSLSFQRKECYSQSLGKPLILNRDLFELGVSIRVPEQGALFGAVKLIGESDPLDLLSFPIEAFPKCFEQDVYKAAVLEYAEYYFERLSKTSNRDLYYGPLSPLLFAVFHNDTDLLTEILSRFGYPTSVRSYWSPLSFSFRFNFPSTMKIICDYIMKNSSTVEISRQDFIFLLNSEKDFCHRLLSQVPSPPKVPYVPSLVTMEEDTNLVYVTSINDLMDLVKDNELSANMLNKRSARECVEETTARTGAQNRARKSVFDRFQENMFAVVENTSKSEVKVLQVPFQYDYRAGTPDSIRFLDMYSKSESEEFVGSAWKEVIAEKWNKVWLFHTGFSLLYFTFTTILTISLVFYPKEAHISDEISKVFIFVFFIYEIMQLVSYAFFNISNYIMDPWNIIDWACFILLLVYFYHSQDDDVDHFQEQLMALISLLVVYYRNFSYLRVIKPLTTFVGIITVCFQKLIVFGFILIYFYMTTALLMVRLFPDDDPWECFANAYFWAFFGAAAPEDFQRSPFAVIVIVFGSIVVTVVLLNILIAYLSNIFCRLEDQQHFDYLREKAAMILDVEILMWFVNYRLNKKSTGELRPVRNTRPKKRTQLFIIKTLDFQDMTEEEDASEKVLTRVEELAAELQQYGKDSQEGFEKLAMQNQMLMQRLDRFAARLNVSTQ